MDGISFGIIIAFGCIAIGLALPDILHLIGLGKDTTEYF